MARAAELHGMKPSEYVLKVLRRASKRSLEQVRTLRYSRRDQLAMLDALLNPPAPSERLKRAWKAYDKAMSQS